MALWHSDWTVPLHNSQVIGHGWRDAMMAATWFMCIVCLDGNTASFVSLLLLLMYGLGLSILAVMR